jgi:hypothetical protein
MTMATTTAQRATKSTMIATETGNNDDGDGDKNFGDRQQ